MLWDAACWAGLLIFVFTFGSEDSSFMIISVVLYVIATRQKREYKAVAFGEITKKDVEFAKAAVVDAEAVEVEESAETALESEETIEE